MKPDDLPNIGGERVDRSIADFVRACRVLLAEEQERPNPNNALIAVLCDAVRLTREIAEVSVIDEHISVQVARREGWTGFAYHSDGCCASRTSALRIRHARRLRLYHAADGEVRADGAPRSRLGRLGS